MARRGEQDASGLRARVGHVGRGRAVTPEQTVEVVGDNILAADRGPSGGLAACRRRQTGQGLCGAQCQQACQQGRDVGGWMSGLFIAAGIPAHRARVSGALHLAVMNWNRNRPRRPSSRLTISLNIFKSLHAVSVNAAYAARSPW
jgi:hypothetical protein